MHKLVHISLSPNLEYDDLLLSLKNIWRSQAKNSLERTLKTRFPHARVYLTLSGRSALDLALRSLSLPKNSVVLLQSFTCTAVVNPILGNKLVPRYLDIESETFNFDIKQLKDKKIWKDVKVLIVQHTFGTPHPRLQEVKKLCTQNGVILIEDCAHSLGAKVSTKPVGTFGDMSIVSFGRDKVVSSVFGGALIINNKSYINPADTLYKNYDYPSTIWTLQQLLHPIVTWLSQKSYVSGLGKLILYTAQKLNIISKAIYPMEKRHQMPKFFRKKMPSQLQALANQQIGKLDRFNKHRQQIAKIYADGIKNKAIALPRYATDSIYLRYNILCEDRATLVNELKKNNIIVGDWYKLPVTPSSNLALAGYSHNDNPKTEYANKHSVNLPTHPLMSMEDAKRIVNIINQWSQ